METETLAANWYKICVSLGLPPDKIDIIKEAGDSYRCWSEALKQWIRQNYNTKKYGKPSWRNLLKGVAQVNKGMSKILAANHQGMLFSFLTHSCTCKFCYV